MVMCLGQGAGLHIAQLMPLPFTISCSNRSRLVFTFLVLAFWCRLTRVGSQNGCVCVCEGGGKVLSEMLWL